MKRHSIENPIKSAKEKAEDNGFGSIRSMSKIEDRPRPKPENGRTATIPQASRERSVRAEDAIEVIDQPTPSPVIFTPTHRLNACHQLYELCYIGHVAFVQCVG